MKTKYMLEDISNLTHRVFHSTNSKLGLKEMEDFYKNKDLYIHNVMNTIETDRKKFQVSMEFTVLAFDSNSWRLQYLSNHDLMDASDYKDGRDQSQKLFIRELIESVFYIVSQMNYIVLKKQNYEADDLIALFIITNVDENTEFLIISNDDDFTQLKQYNTTIFSPNKKQFNEKDFSTVEFKIIKGDTSDNIKKIIPSYTINSDEININFGEGEIQQLIDDTFGDNDYDRNVFKQVVAEKLTEKLIKKGLDVLKKQIKSDELKGRALTAEVSNQFPNVFISSNNFEGSTLEEIQTQMVSEILKRYDLNENLIDFNFIPESLVTEYNDTTFIQNSFPLEAMKKTLVCFKLNELSKNLKG